MSRIWVKTIKKHKTLCQKTVTCDHDDIEEALRGVCKELDIPNPMWLQKQRTEFENFGMTAFTGENFFENVNFDRLELNYLADDGVTHKSSDPRNDFSSF